MNIRSVAIGFTVLLASLAACLGSAHDLDLTVVKIDQQATATNVEVSTPLSRFVRVHGLGPTPNAPELDLAVRSHLGLPSITQATLKIDSQNDVLTWSAIAPVDSKPEVEIFDESTGSARTLVALYKEGKLTSESVLGKPTATQEAGMMSMVRLGGEHILAGLDHILFVVGLALLGGGWKTLLKVLTAFTVAHSVTLAAASLGWVQANPKVVEPLIALSIVALAIESLRQKRDATDRPLVRIALAFGFGLMHGFGFAGGLTEMGLHGPALVQSLVAFSVGIELGQVLVLLPVLALIALLGRFGEVSTRQVRLEKFNLVTAICLGMIGTFWFVERVL